MKRGQPKPSAAAARRKGLVTGLQVVANVFAGLETRQRQPFGSAFAKKVSRQPNRRGR